jgi:hypothetical protein
MLILLTLVFACSKGCGSKESPSKIVTVTQGNPKNNTIIEEDYEEKTSYQSSYSGGGGNTSFYVQEDVQPPALLSEEDIKNIKKRREQSREKLNKNAIEWLKNKTNDPRFCQQTLEKYKVKSHQGFVNGSYAFLRKDYKTAIKCFNETIKDPNATPVTKYFALQNMMNIAYETKDLELYFIAARMNALMCAKEDLSVLGIEKNTHQLEWVEKVEKTIKARNDPKYFDECVKMKLDFYKYGMTKEQAEKEVKKDIEFYTNLYKELIE